MQKRKLARAKEPTGSSHIHATVAVFKSAGGAASHHTSKRQQEVSVLTHFTVRFVNVSFLQCCQPIFPTLVDPFS